MKAVHDRLTLGEILAVRYDCLQRSQALERWGQALFFHCCWFVLVVWIFSCCCIVGWKDLPFSIKLLWHLSSKRFDHICMNLFLDDLFCFLISV